MSESNILFKKIGRVFLETVIESLEKPNESLNTNVNSRGTISNIDIKGDVYDKNSKLVLDSNFSTIDKAVYFGDIYSEEGDEGRLPVLKNGTGYDAQFNGTVGGALSGLIYNYNSGRINNIRNSIASGKNTEDEFKNARLILDPGNTDALDGSAKYYGDVYSTYYDGTDNVPGDAVLLIDSKKQSANFSGGITGNFTGNADSATTALACSGNAATASAAEPGSALANQLSAIPQGVPIGTIVMWSGDNNIPTSWALCDGQNATPDLRGRFVMGSGDGSSAEGIANTYNIGDSGGQETVTLTVDEMPTHNHAIDINDPGHKHQISTVFNEKGSGSGEQEKMTDQHEDKDTKTAKTGITANSKQTTCRDY